MWLKLPEASRAELIPTRASQRRRNLSKLVAKLEKHVQSILLIILNSLFRLFTISSVGSNALKNIFFFEQ